MASAKYIVYDYGGYDVAVIFHEVVDHSRMVEDVIPGDNYADKKAKVKGAGFVTIGVNCSGFVVSCYGKSTTLGIESRESEDNEVVSSTLGYSIFD